MESYSRNLELERGVYNPETGEFPMTLASEGEASDGHILSVRGAEVTGATEVPMLTAHQGDPTLLLGTVGRFKRALSEKPAALKAVGRFNLTDDGTWLSETRRGLATLVQDGDLKAVSVRWAETKAPERRINLPSDHPAHWPSDKEGPGRYGYFFPAWRVLEGSLVSIGADPGALIGRAEACANEAAGTFFRAMARSAETDPEGMAQIADAFAALGGAVAAVRELGCSDADIVNVLGGMTDFEAESLKAVAYGDGRTIYLPRDAWEEIAGESLRYYRTTCRVILDHESRALGREVEADQPDGSRATEDHESHERADDLEAGDEEESVREETPTPLSRTEVKSLARELSGSVQTDRSGRYDRVTGRRI